MLADGARLVVEQGSRLNLENGAVVRLFGDSQIVIKAGATLDMDNGVNLTLVDTESVIKCDEYFINANSGQDIGQIPFSGYGDIVILWHEYNIQNRTISEEELLDLIRQLNADDTVDGILVGLEPVVVAPLLALVLHAVLGHHHAVEAKAPNHGLRAARAYRHGPHAGQARQALHERAAEVVFNVTAVGTDGVERRAHLHAGGTCAAAYHHFTQGYAATHRRLADTVGNHGHGIATHRRRGRHSGRAQRTAWQDEEGKRSHCYLPFHLDEIKMCYGLGAAVNAGQGMGPPPRQSAPAPPKAATAMGAARYGNHGARGRPGRKAD